MTPETTPAIERAAEAVEAEIFGYTTPAGTFVAGAVDFWDDSVQDAARIAHAALAAALDIEEMARAICDSDYQAKRLSGEPCDSCKAAAAAVRASILGGAR